MRAAAKGIAVAQGLRINRNRVLKRVQHWCGVVWCGNMATARCYVVVVVVVVSKVWDKLFFSGDD